MGGGQSVPKVFSYALPPDQGGDLTLLRGALAKHPWQANTTLKGAGSNKGETPAFWAAAHGQVAALRILVGGGADLSIVPPAGHTLPMSARYGWEHGLHKGNPEMLVFLRSNGFDPDGLLSKRGVPLEETAPDIIKDGIGWVPVIFCLALKNNMRMGGSYKKLKELLKGGTDPNVRLPFRTKDGCWGHSNRGETPVFWAAASGDCQNLRLLLSNGADMSLRADEGYTAAHVALWNFQRKKHGNEKMLTFLAEKGHDPDGVLAAFLPRADNAPAIVPPISRIPAPPYNLLPPADPDDMAWRPPAYAPALIRELRPNQSGWVVVVPSQSVHDPDDLPVVYPATATPTRPSAPAAARPPPPPYSPASERPSAPPEREEAMVSPSAPFRHDFCGWCGAPVATPHCTACGRQQESTQKV
mmetsp:Transcript_22129/g.53090  ORF Transcript_22129/g.53090 Transcript_22129/m.53090 type:complete len:414 (+) Transcript_22129:121-1362(+)|eukprot:CAMPEP_0180139502 /NCGR_PEP_ID=MMETSP0986-20121125/13578_1 /TAXON_ID=697907 /ORGANISM="non described non described, Strain CCMP2293" /LENGTH=413 /DNA_ID=CAMNT_0022081631 /DNA_START=121 /DNA_END=1362 /DNA_ORIENTATION=-